MRKRLTVLSLVLSLFLSGCNRTSGSESSISSQSEEETSTTTSEQTSNEQSSSLETTSEESSSESGTSDDGEVIEPNEEFPVTTYNSKRIWLKITSSTWLENAITNIHYFGGTSPETPWPGVPVYEDAANEAFYYDLPVDIMGYMFTRVDIDGNYLNAKTADLNFDNSIDKVYTISGTISGTREQTVAGSYSNFIAATTSVVSAFIIQMNNPALEQDLNVAIHQLNYYYHALSSFERNLFNSAMLIDGQTGSEKMSSLIAIHNLETLPGETFNTLLYSDRDRLSLPATVSASFDLLTSGSNGAFIAWESSNRTVIKVQNGRALVTPPVAVTSVTLTATLKLFNRELTKSFAVNVTRDASTLTVTVTWTVNLPQAIPSGRTLSMGSDQNDWKPSNTSWGRVTKVTDTKYTYTREFVKSGSADSFVMSYKWVLYSASDTSNQWFGVENAPNNTNRQKTISYATSTLAFTDEVSSWENVGTTDVMGSKPLSGGTLTVTQVNNRTIRVYTPSTYDEANINKRYPVIYLQDGQNMFERSTSYAGEWEVDEAIENLIQSKGWDGAIAVGIDNSANRMGEYMYPTGYISYQGTNAVGDVYMNFIVDQIKPFVDANFNTLTDRANTAIAGSSMGGLISFFGGLHRLATFGTILAFSSSTQLISNAAINVPATLSTLDPTLLAKTKFFLYVGTDGDGNQTHPADFESYLKAAGVPSINIQTYLGQGYGHTESAWAKHFPIALSWVVGYGAQ